MEKKVGEEKKKLYTYVQNKQEEKSQKWNKGNKMDGGT